MTSQRNQTSGEGIYGNAGRSAEKSDAAAIDVASKRDRVVHALKM
jgi:hypothetical protein